MTKLEKLKLKANTVIHCNTKELAEKVTEILDKLEITWCSGELYGENLEYGCYGSETCYFPERGEYCSLEYFTGKSYKIISAKEFINLHNNTILDLNEDIKLCEVLKIGDIVTIRNEEWYNKFKNSNGDVIPESGYTTFLATFKQYLGKSFKVTNHITEYSLKLSNGYYFDRCALELVTNLVNSEKIEDVPKQIFNVNTHITSENYKNIKEDMIVKVRDLNWFKTYKTDEGGIYKECHFTSEMVQFCGKFLTIKSIDYTDLSDRIEIKVNEKVAKNFTWNPYMFEKIILPVKDDFIKLNLNENFDDNEMTIGTIVQIRSREWYEKFKNIDNVIDVDIENDQAFIDEMAEFCGKTAKIVSISEDQLGVYEIDIDDQEYSWNSYMFEEILDTCQHINFTERGIPTSIENSYKHPYTAPSKESAEEFFRGAVEATIEVQKENSPMNKIRNAKLSIFKK